VLFNGIFRRARRVWRLSANPVSDVERPSVPRRTGLDFYSPEEVYVLVRAAADEQDGAVYLTAALTGLRLGELPALRWREVDFAAQTIRVVASYTAGQLGTPKSGLGRAVPLVDDVGGALARLAAREHFTDPDDLVFVGVAGGFLDGSALRRRYKRARDTAQLRPLRFHEYATLSAAWRFGRLTRGRCRSGWATPTSRRRRSTCTTSRARMRRGIRDAGHRVGRRCDNLGAGDAGVSGFDGFRESADAPFYRSGAMTPEETWREASERLVRVLDGVRDQASFQPAMSVERICRWHRAIFLTTFPRDAGRLRDDGEPVWFTVVVGVGQRRSARLVEGTRGRAEIARQMGRDCDLFAARMTSLGEDRSAATLPAALEAAASLYAAILRVHPFVDGNLRAAFVALEAALDALSLPGVIFDGVLERHDEAVGWALRGDEPASMTPLVDLLRDLLRPG